MSRTTREWSCAACLSLVQPLYAEQLPIANPGFESPVPADGTFSDNVATGWHFEGMDGPQQAGIYNPTSADWPAEAPEGQGVFYLRRGSIHQVIPDRLIAGAQYQVSFFLGDSLVQPFGSATVELRIGQMRVSLSGTPPSGQFVRFQSAALTFPPGPGLEHVELWIIKNDDDASTVFFLDDISIRTLPSPRCPYDVTGNLVVDLGDLAVVLGHFGETSGASHATGDVDGDQDVDLDDLGLLLSHFGTAC